MYTAAELDPKPQTITVKFNKPVTLWPIGKSSYGESVDKVTIKNPVYFKYHTYGSGIVTYFVEWFSESVRPLRKYELVFDSTDIESMKIDNVNS